MFDINNFYWRIADGRVWSALDGAFVTEPPEGAEVIDLPGENGPATLDDLKKTIQFYQGLGFDFPLSDVLLSSVEIYHKARAAVTNELESVLTASQEIRTAEALKVPRNDQKLGELSARYQAILQEGHAKFDQIDADNSVASEDSSAPTPFTASCFYCAVPMKLKSITVGGAPLDTDYWECPVCGRRVPLNQALRVTVPVDAASDFNAAVAYRLDQFAREKNYDSIITAMATINVPAFAADGQAAANAYGLTWSYIVEHDLTGQVVGGTLTIAEAVAQLPALSWDSAA